MKALSLIIGNADYALQANKLINAVNDANDFGEKLQNLGFEVNKAINCNNETFEREIIDFGEKLKDYDVGLFYFSGHGLQIDGKNYLTSIDTSFVDTISLKHTSFPLDEIIEYMQKANPVIKILILDACRDNPLPNQYRSGFSEGLAPIHAPKGTLIAFSTSPGEKALDYGSGQNSIYTGALLNHLNDPNIPIEDFFKRVRTSVFTLSNGKQTSWEHTSLIGNYCFNYGQLSYSVDLPYNKDIIADEDFHSSGSIIDELIISLKSQNWYKQQSAIEKLKSIKVDKFDKNSLFLLGRNILQTAIGEEFTAIEIMRDLDPWLSKYFIGNENHLLNGILFEIYFNSKGKFRQEDLKNDFFDTIFILESNIKYKKSFEFIQKQLVPFREFLFYIPTNPPESLPIEIKFEKKPSKIDFSSDIDYYLVSVKHQEIELLKRSDDYSHNTRTYNFTEFYELLIKQLSVPKKQLRLSMNFNKSDIQNVLTPMNFKLARNHKVEEFVSY